MILKYFQVLKRRPDWKDTAREPQNTEQSGNKTAGKHAWW